MKRDGGAVGVDRAPPAADSFGQWLFELTRKQPPFARTPVSL